MSDQQTELIDVLDLSHTKIKNKSLYVQLRATIQEYQVKQNISGLNWIYLQLGERIISFPEIHPQLSALPEDLIVLQNYKDLVVDAFLQQAQGKTIWSMTKAQKVDQGTLLAIASSANWARIFNLDFTIDPQFNLTDHALTLEIGLGDPNSSQFSGSSDCECLSFCFFDH